VSEMAEIKPGTARAVNVTAGQVVRVVNTQGHQVVDTWAFSVGDLREHLSMEHSRSATYRILYQPGDVLVSTHFRPMLTILADTSPGIHDTLHAACSAESNVFYGAPAEDPNCQDNLKGVMAERGLALDSIPCPWNLFEHAVVQADGSLLDEPSAAAAGDYVELRAEMDLVLVCSACPSSVGDISQGEPRGAAIELIS
jgi:uncharacterized protein